MTLWTTPKTRILSTAIGGLALLGLAGVAVAKPGATVSAADGPRGDLCAKLECSDAQREELQAVITELRADAKADRAAIERLQGQLAAEFAKAAPDEAAMRATQAKIASHEQQLRDRGLDAMLEVHALLSPQQRATLAKMIEHRGLRGLMHGRKGRSGKGRSGERKSGERKSKAKATEK